MAKRRATAPERQIPFRWLDPLDILSGADTHGEVIYEATDVARVAKSSPPKLPRIGPVKPRITRRARVTVGLPFGAREFQGRIVCWSCTQELAEADLVRTGPGSLSCPGCGARLPFIE